MLVLLHLLVHTNRVTGSPRCRERDAICVVLPADPTGLAPVVNQIDPR